MPVYYIDAVPTSRFCEIQLPNGEFRYEGYHSAIKYCIDSKTRKTKEDIIKFLDGCSVDFLIDMEGYIVNIK